MRCGKLIGCCALSLRRRACCCVWLCRPGGMVFVLAGGVVAAGVAIVLDK